MSKQQEKKSFSLSLREITKISLADRTCSWTYFLLAWLFSACELWNWNQKYSQLLRQQSRLCLSAQKQISCYCTTTKHLIILLQWFQAPGKSRWGGGIYQIRKNKNKNKWKAISKIGQTHFLGPSFSTSIFLFYCFFTHSDRFKLFLQPIS